jgi:hypothetical protein
MELLIGLHWRVLTVRSGLLPVAILIIPKTNGPRGSLLLDALSRAAAERELHALHDVYIDAGVQFRPRHVKILACRVLHRDMTSNALHLLHVMKSQIVSAAREYAKEVVALYREGYQNQTSFSSSPNSPSSSFPYFSSYQSSSSSLSSQATLAPPSHPLQPSNSFYPISSSLSATSATSHKNVTASNGFSMQIRDNWLQALRSEITENDEWDTRMRTTQLEGGPRGGAYRISRPPEDALKFLEEARGMVAELLGVEKDIQKERDRIVHGGISMGVLGRRMSLPGGKGKDVTSGRRNSNGGQGNNNRGRMRPTPSRRMSVPPPASDNASERTITLASTSLTVGVPIHTPLDDDEDDNFDAAPAAAPASDGDDEEDTVTISGSASRRRSSLRRRSSNSRGHMDGLSRRMAAWWNSLSDRLNWESSHHHHNGSDTPDPGASSSFNSSTL